MPVVYGESGEVRMLSPGFEVRVVLDKGNGSQVSTIVNETLRPGYNTSEARHRVERAMYVYGGQGLIDIEGEEKHRLKEGAGVVIPGDRWYSIENDGKEDLKYLAIYPAVDVVRETKDEPRSPVPIFHEKDIEPRQNFPGVSHVTAIEYANGSQAVTLGKVTIQPGCEIPPHSHPVEDAAIVIEGKGLAYTSGGTVPIEAGSHIYVPPNGRHGVKNTGDKPLVFIWCWPAINVARDPL